MLNPLPHNLTQAQYREFNRTKTARPSKYNAKRTEYAGERYDSALEAHVAWTLDVRKLEGEIRTIRRQVPFPMIVKGVLICTYRADFLIETKDGKRTVVEAKGVSTPAWKLKEKLFRALYPRTPIEIVTSKARIR